MKRRLASVLVMMLSTTIIGCGITAINVDGTEPQIESTSEETEDKETADTEDKQIPEIEVTLDSSENVTKEEGIYVYNEESQISEIALSFSLKISPRQEQLLYLINMIQRLQKEN